MNRFLKYFLGLICISLFAPAYAKLQVFACEPEWAALTQALGGQHISVTTATHAKQNPHQIEARPSLISAARRADLMVCTGAGLEDGWLPMIQQKANNPKILPGQIGSFMASDYVSLKEKPAQLDRLHGDVHPDGNPHIQLDPRFYPMIAKALSEKLIALDPTHQNVYQAQYEAFQKDWAIQMKRWQLQAKSLKGMKVVVYHNSWFYLADWLELKTVAALEPKPGIPPSTAHLTQVLSQVKTTPVQVILYSTYESPKAANWLSQKTGTPAIQLPATVGGTKESESLEGLFETIIQKLLTHAHEKH